MKLWGHTVQFKLLLGYIAILIALVASTILVLQTQLRSRLEEQTLKQVDTNGEIIVAELVRQTSIVNTLTQSLVNFASHSDNDPDLIKQILPSLINLPNTENFIAGGGYWPEPYAFSSDKELSSFFWGRNKAGKLEYYDDYNNPQGPGYHHEEWYAPAKYLAKGNCYWSRSYTDPYSGQPMVTCTISATKGDTFIGAATIDLKLTGLTELFAQHTKNTGGYAFVVDQHNRFISFPNANTVQSTIEKGNITTSELAQTDQRFTSINTALLALTEDIQKQAIDNKKFDTNLAQEIANDSYQINLDEAKIIAATLANPLKDISLESLLLKRMEVSSDIILNEVSTVSIFHVPNAYWKVVIVTPKDVALSSVQTLIEDSLVDLLLPLIGIMLLAFIGIKFIILKPISSITNALKTSVEQGGIETNALDESNNDEFGQLAHWYNQKNKELKKAISQLSEMNKELTYHANYDALTNLSNRRHFETQLQNLIASDEWDKHSLLYLDMDQFKVINDTCGHIAGDQLLIQISNNLKKILRDGDSVARIGGDEFAIIARTPERFIVDKVSTRILDKIGRLTFSWEGSNFNISCSIGVLYLADINPNATLAMKYVDTACYAAKESGRNRYHLYQQNDLASLRAGEMNWVSKINDAFEHDLFFNEFQVIAPTTLYEDTPCCIESLVRIKQEDGTLIPPGAFLPAAERYNTIAKIDRWVIRNTMRLLASNQTVLDKIRFCSINLSGDSIGTDDISDYIDNCLKEFSLPASKFCFEITETQAVFNIQQAKICLKKIQELGSLIALDDFGSGMSSYGYLTQLPVNFLKIDGSFVKNIKNDNISLTFVKSMGDIAAAMNLETIAEFVEDMETYHLLRGIGINYAQGYGISKPLPIETLASFLSEHIIEKTGA